jgi:hypothetical protein
MKLPEAAAIVWHERAPDGGVRSREPSDAARRRTLLGSQRYQGMYGSWCRIDDCVGQGVVGDSPNDRRFDAPVRNRLLMHCQRFSVAISGFALISIPDEVKHDCLHRFPCWRFVLCRTTHHNSAVCSTACLEVETIHSPSNDESNAYPYRARITMTNRVASYLNRPRTPLGVDGDVRAVLTKSDRPESLRDPCLDLLDSRPNSGLGVFRGIAWCALIYAVLGFPAALVWMWLR